MLMLLEQSGQEVQVWSGLFRIVIVIVLASAGAMLVGHLVKRWRNSLDDSAPYFTIAQLREMRDQGELTTHEYDKLKKKTVENSKY